MFRTQTKNAVAPDLWEVAEHGNIGRVRTLLQHHREPAVLAHACCVALRHAPRIAGLSRVRWNAPEAARTIVSLLTDATGTPDPRDAHGFTPLLRAASCGDVLTLELWLDHGADAAAVTPNGRNALHLLEQDARAQNSRLDFLPVALRLAANGCNPDAFDAEGNRVSDPDRRPQRRTLLPGGHRLQAVGAWQAWAAAQQMQGTLPSAPTFRKPVRL